MEVSELIALLGKSTEDPGIGKLLNNLNIKKQPKAKHDEPRFDVEVKKQGWGMAFEDEDYLLDADVKQYGEGRMILATLFFYPEGNKAGYKGFKGDLMNGVRLTDTRSEILQKLGEPHAKYERDGVLRNERWNYGDYRLVMIYTPEGKVKDAQVISQHEIPPKKIEKDTWPVVPAQGMLKLLGKSADDPTVKKLLQDFGVKREPELDEDDEEAVTDWLPVRKAGVEFGFEIEGSLEGEIGTAKYAGPLILHKIIFYCAFEGMESYQGELPHGILKTDNRREVVSKLAQFESARRAYIRDVWELPNHRLTVTYTEGDKSVRDVICTLRPYPYSRTLPDIPPLPSMEQIIDAFGSPARSEQMSALFGTFHIEDYKDEIFEDYEADLRLDYGFELYFCPGTDIALKQKRLVFSGLKFYRDRDLDSRGWPGELPFGLQFDDDPSTMLRKVGVKPVKHQDDDLDGTALWHFERFSLHVYYSNLENCLYRVMVLAPGYWQSLD